MSGKSRSIGQVMAIIALVAVNLALLRSVEWMILGAYGFVLGVVDYLILRRMILRRPLRAFHYTLLIVIMIGSVVLAVQVAMGRLRLARPIVRWYQRVTGDLTGGAAWSGFIETADFGAAGLLGLLIALAAGLIASRLENNRGWDVAAFWRGALVGFGVLALINTFLYALDLSGPEGPGAVARYGLLAAFVVLGGLVGLAKLKSKDQV